MSWTLDGDSISSDNAHFHGPASPSQTAGVQEGLTGLTSATTGTHAEVISLDETQEADLLGTLWYLNIHSNQWGAGELRGQMATGLSDHSYPALPINGAQSGIATSASGTISAAYYGVNDQFTFCIKWAGLSGPVTVAHLHAGDAGMTGPPVVDLHTLPGFPLADNGIFAATVTIPSANEAALLNDGIYINLHTTANGGGEIRGQLIEGGVTAVNGWSLY